MANSKLIDWRNAPDPTKPTDALSVAIPTEAYATPALQAGPAIRTDLITPYQASLDVAPDMFSRKNWRFDEQTPEDKQRALDIYGTWGYDAVVQAGLQPPEIPHGNVAGFIRSMASGITAMPHETEMATPFWTTTGRLVGEGIKYAGIGKLLGAVGLSGMPQMAATSAVSAAQRELVDSPNDQGMSAGLEIGAGIMAPAIFGAVGEAMGKVKIPGIDDGVTVKPATTPIKPVADVPIPDKNTIGAAGDIMLNSGVAPQQIKQLQDLWGGVVDNVAESVKKAVYKAAPDVSKRIHDFFVGNAPTPVKDILEQRSLQINRGKVRAAELGRSIRENIPKQYQSDAFKILDPDALGEMGSIPTKYHQTIAQARQAIDDLGMEMTQYGLDLDTYYAGVGKYLGRYYKRNLAREFGQFVGGVRAKGFRLMRRKLKTPEERRAAGIITDPAYAVSRTIGDITYDLETYKAFRAIAKNPEWAKSTWEEGFHPKALPGNTKIYGDLAGKYVIPEVRDEIMSILPSRDAYGRMYDHILGLWKAGKTAWSPATHGRNIFSNMILADLGGLSPITGAKYYVRAAKEFRKKGPLYREAEQSGLFGTDWFGNEVKPMLDGVAKIGSKENVSDKLFAWLNESKLGRALDVPGNMYQGEEQFFKLAMYTQGRAQGLTPELAAARAQKYLFDYGKLSPGLRNLKRSWFGHPFLTFTAKAFPVVAETAAKHPFRTFKYIAAMKMMNAYSKNQLGMSDEEYNNTFDLLPDWQKNGFNMLLPWRDKNGHPLMWDLTYNLPWGNIADQGRVTSGLFGVDIPVLSSIADNFVLGNPIPNTAIGMLANKDIFKNREIVSARDRDMGNTVMPKLKFVAQQALPTGVYSVAQTIRAISGEKMRSGDARSIIQTIADKMLGLRVRPLDQETNKSIKTWQEIGKIKELKKAVRSLEFDESLSPEERKRQQKELLDAIDQIAAEAERIDRMETSGSKGNTNPKSISW